MKEIYSESDSMKAQEMSREVFDNQVARLIVEHGAEAFAGVWNQPPRLTLFVEEQRVVAESSESPRHRYGAFCELDEWLTGTALTERVRHWLDSGEAYELYVGMNVCRYHCG